jgi:alginate O-acetyltransferase complex protein AlgI
MNSNLPAIKDAIRLEPSLTGRSHLGRKWLPALFPVLFCAGAARDLPGWVFMWLLAVSLFVGAKWVTIADRLSFRSVPPTRLAAYLFLWPGLNPEEFCFESGRRPSRDEWLGASAKTVLGAAIVWGAVRFLPERDSLLIAWLGMFGIVLLLHFGLFHLVSNLWRSVGFNAMPLMRNPLRATSLAEFWGNRWNKGFHDLMTPHVFAPLARRFGAMTAVLSVFLISGLLHEIVLSVPARGGFGLPTLYFVAQAAGLLLERSNLGRSFGLGHGLSGWLFTAAVTGGLAYWLFSPIFVRNVILPMLQAIGAT